MEIVSLGFNGENPLRIQCNLDKPHNIIMEMQQHIKAVNKLLNRSKIPYFSNNNNYKKDNYFVLSNKLMKGQITKGLNYVQNMSFPNLSWW